MTLIEKELILFKDTFFLIIDHSPWSTVHNPGLQNSF
jgi:hypothetical protein